MANMKSLWKHCLFLAIWFLLLLVVVTTAAKKSGNVNDKSQLVSQDKYGIFVVQTIQELEHVVEISKTTDAFPLVIVLVYKPSCPSSKQLYELLPQAKAIMQADLSLLKVSTVGNDKWAVPLFVTISVEDFSEEDQKELASSLGVTTVPSLFFHKAQLQTAPLEDDGQWRQSEHEEEEDYANMDMAFVMDYTGLSSTPDDLARGLWHYSYRLRLGTMAHKRQQTTDNDSLDVYVDLVPMSFSSLTDLQRLLTNHGTNLFSRVPHPLDPEFSSEETSTIQYLLNADDHPDPFVVVAICQSTQQDNDDESHKLIHDEFGDVARVLSLRRDVLFCRLQNSSCRGTIETFLVDENWNLQSLARWNHNNGGSNSSNKHSQSLLDFATSAITPSLLYLDRQVTAPIAFASKNKVHFALFVDLHHPTSKPESQQQLRQTQETIRNLRHICQAQKYHVGNGINNTAHNVVCLIVPSTDTRILTTFGIDIWSPLDSPACGESGEESPENALPTLVITDQRGSGTKRFRLDPPKVHSFRDMVDFVQDFWQDNAPLQFKSSARKSRINRQGVHIVTAHDFERVVQKSTKHVLIMLVAPTCGHCKRLGIMWNQLAELVFHLQWDSFVEICKMDITANEVFVEGMVVSWLPDVYYFAPSSTKPIRYEKDDELGDGVGRLSDPLDMVEWLLDVADGLNEQELLTQLEEEEQKPNAKEPPKEE
jgi:thioredoxin-related protein